MPRAELGFEKEGGFLVNVISRHVTPVKKLVLILAHVVFCLFKPIKPPPIDKDITAKKELFQRIYERRVHIEFYVQGNSHL